MVCARNPKLIQVIDPRIPVRFAFFFSTSLTDENNTNIFLLIVRW